MTLVTQTGAKHLATASPAAQRTNTITRYAGRADGAPILQADGGRTIKARRLHAIFASEALDVTLAAGSASTAGAPLLRQHRVWLVGLKRRRPVLQFRAATCLMRG